MDIHRKYCKKSRGRGREKQVAVMVTEIIIVVAIVDGGDDYPSIYLSIYLSIYPSMEICSNKTINRESHNNMNSCNKYWYDNIYASRSSQ